MSAEKQTAPPQGATTATSSSTRQIYAPDGEQTIWDAEAYRKYDNDLWGTSTSGNYNALYGLYIEQDSLYAEPHTIKITDAEGGILWHFLFPLGTSVSSLVNRGTIYMIPGDQTQDNPRKGRKGHGFPWSKGPKPPTSDGYTWKLPLSAKTVEDIEGRMSDLADLVSEDKHQTVADERGCRNRDYIEFSVPSATNGQIDRTFVWLCTGIMRNYSYTRWDQCRYSLVEKGTSVQYGDFQWSEACSIRLREGIPPDLDHSMIIFALVTLLLMQFEMSTGFTPQDFCPTDGTDTTVHRFNGAALRKLAAEYGIRR